MGHSQDRTYFPLILAAGSLGKSHRQVPQFGTVLNKAAPDCLVGDACNRGNPENHSKVEACLPKSVSFFGAVRRRDVARLALFDRPIVMLDFETTGLSPAMGDRITEVAALRIADGVVAERYVTPVNRGARIPHFVTALTGISQRMVEGAPPVTQVMPHLLEFIGGDVLSAHNASFDAKFLLAESQRQGLSPRHGGLICSLKLARRMLPGQCSYKLGALAHALNINFGGAAHRAEADAEVSARLLLHIGEVLQRQYRCQSIAPSLLEVINRQSAAKVSGFLGRRFASS